MSGIAHLLPTNKEKSIFTQTMPKFPLSGDHNKQQEAWMYFTWHQKTEAFVVMEVLIQSICGS